MACRIIACNCGIVIIIIIRNLLRYGISVILYRWNYTSIHPVPVRVAKCYIRQLLSVNDCIRCARCFYFICCRLSNCYLTSIRGKVIIIRSHILYCNGLLSCVNAALNKTGNHTVSFRKRTYVLSLVEELKVFCCTVSDK